MKNTNRTIPAPIDGKHDASKMQAEATIALCDTVSLLRENADLDEAEGGNPNVCALERIAADEIESLRLEVARLRAMVSASAASKAVHDAAIEEAAQALDRLHEENRRWHNEFRDAAAVVRALKQPAATSAQPGEA